MVRSTLVVFVLSFTLTLASRALICPQNEQYYFEGDETMPPCGWDQCGVDPMTIRCSSVGVSGCFCKPGYQRNCQNVCVPKDECREGCSIKCPPNEYWHNGMVSPGPLCGRDDCAFDPTVARCPPNHDSKCYCVEGYKRDCKGNCIPERECSKCACEPGKCPPNEQWYDGTNCQGYICGNDDCSFDPRVARCFPNCHSDCYCQEGYRRLKGVCVPERECPQFVPLVPF